MFVYCRAVSNLVATLYFSGRVKCLASGENDKRRLIENSRLLTANMLSSCSAFTQYGVIFCITHLRVVAKATPDEMPVELKSYVLKFYSAKILL